MTSPNMFTNSVSDSLINQVEVLRQILESEQRRHVTLQEAQEIGEDLLVFYETLAMSQSADQTVGLSGVD